MNNIIVELLKTGNIYIVVLAILLFICYLGVRFFIKDYRKTKKESFLKMEDCNNGLKKTITDNDRVFYKNIKQIIEKLDSILNEVYKIEIDLKDTTKDIEHKQEKIFEKVEKNNKTISEIRDEVINLKYKVELMLVQKDNTSTINKGL